MKKFEYYAICIRSYEDPVQTLDDFGEDGWEAFEMMPDGDKIIVYLKREKST